MGLRDGYGVLLGTLTGYRRDDPNDFGRFMHGVLTVSASGSEYKCAVDVDTRNGAIPIQWRIQPLRSSEWGALFQLTDGWHALVSSAQSGAVDYIRDPRLRDLIFIPEYVEARVEHRFPNVEWSGYQMPHQMPVVRKGERFEHVRARFGSAGDDELLRAPVGHASRILSSGLKIATASGKIVSFQSPWNSGSSEQALTDLESVISNPIRVMVFGAPFRIGRGVHDIHQNQGDPVGGGFDQENAIWQDGVTIAIRADGTASAFMNKFSTQADATDDGGHPVP